MKLEIEIPDNLAVSDIACIKDDVRFAIVQSLEKLDLKPCPFCGCEEVAVQRVVTKCGYPNYCVKCFDCKCSSGLTNSKGRATSNWNQRRSAKKKKALSR